MPPAGVNIVVVPVTVRDSKGKLVPGLTYRDFRVYENKERQRITYFSTDAVPLSVAFVIDQSVSVGTMQKVNQSLSAVTGAFTPYDEVAVYTYNNGPEEDHRLYRRAGQSSFRRARGGEASWPRDGGSSALWPACHRSDDQRKVRRS